METRDIFTLKSQMTNYDIMAKLTNLGAITDLMKYEVKFYMNVNIRFLTDPVNPGLFYNHLCD